MAHNSRQCSHTEVHCRLKVPILALLSLYPVIAVYLGSMPTCVFGGCLLASLFHPSIQVLVSAKVWVRDYGTAGLFVVWDLNRSTVCPPSPLGFPLFLCFISRIFV